jgi:hypothetical protein
MLSSKVLTFAYACSLVGSIAAAQDAAPQAAPAAPTVQVDSRLAGWLGCWRLQDDQVGSNLRICVTPEQTTGVKLQTLVGGQKGTTQLVVPDNVTRPITDADCKGTEKSEWSKDGLRVFSYTDVTCGKESPRKLASVSFLMHGPTFVQVQFVESDQNKSVRVQRYRRAADQTLADGTPAPKPAAALVMAAPSPDVPWDIDDVVEASGKLPADAVQAALTEVSGPFQLNKKTLLAMSDAKVAPSVIDLMVALTYPQKLVVNRAGSSYSGGGSGISMGYGLYDPFMSPLIAASALYPDCYSMYGFSYPYCGSYLGYRPYGYYGYGYYGGYYPGYPGYPYYGGGGWVVVDPNPGQPAVPQPEGRAIKGLGYTQIRPREPEPAPRIGNTGGNGNATSGTSGTNSNSGGSNSGSSGATSGGYSGGSSTGGGDGARIAVPRPPGGY